MTDKISGYSTTEPVVPVKSGSANSAVSNKSQAATAAPVASAATGDTLTLTSSARSLQKVEEAIAAAPTVNADKVASVKQAVNSGTYQINAGSITNKLLQFERGLK